MARMHARKKGKSGSTKPAASSSDKWLEYNNDEIIKLIVTLGTEGMSPSVIGVTLRDQYGIPDVKKITKKSITEILKEKKLATELPEGFINLLKQALKLRKHIEKNPHDNSNNRGLQLTESKIKRLIRYYKAKKLMPKDFYYDVKNIELLLR
jgi:small subunit ribosomal protein S15